MSRAAGLVSPAAQAWADSFCVCCISIPYIGRREEVAVLDSVSGSCALVAS